MSQTPMLFLEDWDDGRRVCARYANLHSPNSPTLPNHHLSHVSCPGANHSFSSIFAGNGEEFNLELSIGIRAIHSSRVSCANSAESKPKLENNNFQFLERAMVAHLASLAENRLILSFAPKTFYYDLLKRVGSCFRDRLRRRGHIYMPRKM